MMDTYGEGYEAGEEHGERAERVRLRPLLERCLAALEVRESGPWPPGTTPIIMRTSAAADLRRELGKETA